MNEAAFAMIEQIAERKSLSTIDAYSLTSLTMDTRLGDIADTKKCRLCPNAINIVIKNEII